MTLPGWLLSKTALTVGVSAIVLGGAGLWWNAHNAKVRRVAVAEERTRVIAQMQEQQLEIKQAYEDSLRTEQLRNDALIQGIRPVVTSYETQRARIPTMQPPNVPAGMVLVSREYVEAADALSEQVTVLIGVVERERLLSDRRAAAADSVIVLQNERIVQLEILVKEGRVTLVDKAKYAAIGGAIGYAIFKVLEK